MWVMELRDPWTGNPSKPAFARSGWSDAVERWLERRCLRMADHVVTVTQATADRLRPEMAHVQRSGDGSRLVVARNGIDQRTEPSSGTATTPTIIYVGNLYSGRDPRPFFSAVGRLRERGLLPVDLRIELIGECQFYEGTAVDDIARDAGILDITSRPGTLPHDECMRRVRGAAALLLLAQGQPEQVPNKLYEYLGAGRPIIAFADEGGETAAMLRSAGSPHLVVNHDPCRADQAITEALRSAVTGAGSALDQNVLDEWSTENQMRRLLTALRL
jgi:glycosyltransferase involved in cell wall biosynthesis